MGETSVKALAGLRIVIGVLSWVAPNLAGTLFGLDVKKNKQAPYLARLFGVRDIALGVGTLMSTGAARRTWLQMGLVCDTADAAAAGIGHHDGYLDAQTAIMVAAPAVAAVGMGAAALGIGDDSDTHRQGDTAR
ncbi:MAG TPA: hypothetical protein VEX39_10495 [Thermoleophilaceae bacterium]|nr:hypothetical protein [Thermoleophilaceae bacterium]